MSDTVVIRSRLGDTITSTMRYSEKLKCEVEHIEISAANVPLPRASVIDQDFDVLTLIGVRK